MAVNVGIRVDKLILKEIKILKIIKDKEGSTSDIQTSVNCLANVALLCVVVFIVDDEKARKI